MQAFKIVNSHLKLTECPIPTPANHQVLIKIAAAGVNRPDIMQRKGLYPAPLGASDTPGLEISGTIVATGAMVTHLKPSDTVCALVTGGGYANIVWPLHHTVYRSPKACLLFRQRHYLKLFLLFGVMYLIAPNYCHTKHCWYMAAAAASVQQPYNLQGV